MITLLFDICITRILPPLPVYLLSGRGYRNIMDYCWIQETDIWMLEILMIYTKVLPINNVLWYGLVKGGSHFLIIFTAPSVHHRLMRICNRQIISVT